ncbi:SpvB/TcaC N-terminal domain-containing protein [Leptothoe spongobia]|uniref:Toxin n=1 Tax=Leptothoe spongobia TAU-MAC 1115 TaxID=1967444 RepID=A0A947DCR3_9CYAN|nr:SpvB/TcaC N-terminal domain-containing protein [Leptothoe spongobia]MBT9313994.1 hypothetical protein [Leptothoe spongobia TAU-MAC 1115]
MNNDRRIETPQLSLPKGGGAIQGIGETFQSTEFTGAATLSIPIPTTPCRGSEPQLSVGYSSGSGNGIFGLGFDLTIPNIARKTSKAIPKYNDTDRNTDIFLFSNAEDLVPVVAGKPPESGDPDYTVIAYRPRVEGLFAKIERWTHKTTKETHWRVVSAENVISLFGKTNQARIYNPEQPNQVFQWLLEEVFDATGNCVVYQYKAEDTTNVPDVLFEKNRVQTANKYIERIKYGNDAPLVEGQDLQATKWYFEVVFDYGEYEISSASLKAKQTYIPANPYTPINPWKNRQDPFSTYHAGFEMRTHRLCRNILMFHRFEEELGETPILVHATRFHYDQQPNLTQLKTAESVGYRYHPKKNGQAAEYEAKGLPPIEFGYTTFTPKKYTFEAITQDAEQPLPGLNLPPNYQSIDLYGEGIPGVLYSDGATTLYWEPQGTSNGADVGVRYAQPKQLESFPIERQVQASNRMLMDLAGDGRTALVVSDPGASGYYHYDPDQDTWQGFQPFSQFPTDFSNLRNQMVDVTGDGLMDILLVDRDRLQVYPSEGERGFALPLLRQREHELPMAKSGDVEEVLQFADLFGTGKQHLVRITNGAVECWPNLGYGKFGNKVQLGDAPRFEGRLDASRLFLVDIDGSGTADIAYVSRDRIQIWFNHSGNAFSDPLTIALPSRWDNLQQINFADILGNGTTGVVFSENHVEPRHWYYDFCGKKKPYLLNTINNNLGAITNITYASSTRFYLQDKRQGTPWVTKLPFPVQVVEKVEAIDQISQTRLVSLYSYHHGYYDRAEHEFRGFGRVERQDAETISDQAKSTDVSPILTKTWYHTGAWQQEASLFEQYEQEYFKGDARAAQVFKPVFEWGDHTPNDTEVRQAHMALKATVLRSEVYGLDKSALKKNPYSVSEAGFKIKCLRSQGNNQDAVFYVWERENLAYAYERNPEDPRIAHTITVKIDDYGNVEQSCAIAYGRRAADALPEQKSLKVTYTENRFVHLDQNNGVRLLGVPVESQTYELTGLGLDAGKEYFDSERIAEKISAAKRTRLSWERHFYWNQSLDQILGSGQVGPQGLLARSEGAVVEKQKIESVFSEVLNTSELETYLRDQGKYQFDQGYWWNPGLTQTYGGQDHFYLPTHTTDPFGHISQVEYDNHKLLVKKVTDAIGNEMTVETIDYQTLQPQKITDLNNNVSAVRFDPLGMVMLTSLYGTENGKRVGFSEVSDAPLPAFKMADAISNPQTYLQGTGSYFYYDLFAWKDNQQPVYAVNLIAENYNADTRVQTQITYSDGFGREVQTKMRVDAGKVFSVKADGSLEEKETSTRWLSSGHKLYNNKGKPIREYEPYYIDTHGYVDHPSLNRYGVSSELHYDPLDRPIRMDTPKGFFTKVEFTPWEEQHYDENDTVKDSPYYKKNHNNKDLPAAERQALEKAAQFYDTPEIKVLDNLGQTVREIQLRSDQRRLETRYGLDIVGNQLSSVDPRLAAQGSDLKNFQMEYDLMQTELRTVSADGGTQWSLNNVMGNPIYGCDARGFVVTTEYDALHRPVAVGVKGGDGEQALDNWVERMVYGDSVEDAEAKNLRGQLYQHYDSAGRVQVDAYSLDGQPLTTQRQLRDEYKLEANWNGETQSDEELLQDEIYVSTARYDALGRVIEERDADENVHRPVYDLTGSLVQLQITHSEETEPTSYVNRIEYDAKGQRTQIEYGNGVTTTYEYERETFYLKRILTQRPDQSLLQDLNYVYDPVGNITQIGDKAWDTVFNNNQKVDPVSTYSYDALYRLEEATGRQHMALGQRQRSPLPDEDFVPLQSLNNGQAVENYIRRYSYDDGGNLYRIRHESNHGNHTQRLTVSDRSNRAVESDLLTATQPQPMAAAVEIDRFFDANGNQTRTKGMGPIRWNYRDNIASVTIVDRKENGLNDVEFYVYDSSGDRVRKVMERYGSGGTVAHVEEVVYLGGVEIRRTRRDETLTEERRCLRVMDDERCIAVRNRWTEGEPPAGVKRIQVRYQLENHLGSAAMEVDDAGQLISYEEYFPYGGTAFVAGRNAAEVKLKHYRYSGKERDGSTGLYYYGARYYAPWLGRWMSCDPAGTVDGLNLYGFVGGNPITNNDADGRMFSKIVKKVGKYANNVFNFNNFNTQKRFKTYKILRYNIEFKGRQIPGHEQTLFTGKSYQSILANFNRKEKNESNPNEKKKIIGIKEAFEKNKGLVGISPVEKQTKEMKKLLQQGQSPNNNDNGKLYNFRTYKGEKATVGRYTSLGTMDDSKSKNGKQIGKRTADRKPVDEVLVQDTELTYEQAARTVNYFTDSFNRVKIGPSGDYALLTKEPFTIRPDKENHCCTFSKGIDEIRAGKSIPGAQLMPNDKKKIFENNNIEHRTATDQDIRDLSKNGININLKKKV